MKQLFEMIFLPQEQEKMAGASLRGDHFAKLGERAKHAGETSSSFARTNGNVYAACVTSSHANCNAI